MRMITFLSAWLLLLTAILASGVVSAKLAPLSYSNARLDAGNLITTESSTTLNDWAGGNDTGIAQVNGNLPGGSAGVTNFEGDIAIFRFYEKVLDDSAVLENFHYVVTGGAP